MKIHKQTASRLALLIILTFVYFSVFPQDVAVFLNPVEKILNVSNTISPWMYLILGVAILSWTAIRIWGTGPGSAERLADSQN